MKEFDIKKFNRGLKKIDDSITVSFLKETRLLIENPETTVLETFKKFFLFMGAEKPADLAEQFSNEDIIAIASQLNDIGRVLSGSEGISYASVHSDLNKAKSVGRRIL